MGFVYFIAFYFVTWQVNYSVSALIKTFIELSRLYIVYFKKDKNKTKQKNEKINKKSTIKEDSSSFLPDAASVFFKTYIEASNFKLFLEGGRESRIL